MIFSELYSVYYNTVAAILKQAMQQDTTERELQRLVSERAFSESALTILPSLKSGKWQLAGEDMSPVLHHIPTMPLTLLQKRWLKSIMDDPRIRLFDLQLPDLEGIEPLFTREDYKIYDKYEDGDPFEDDAYIARFYMLREAVRSGSPVSITMRNRYGAEVRERFYPVGFEYSEKDDKLRVIASGCRYRQFNLARMISCRYYHGSGPWREPAPPEQPCEVTLEITNRRNALERVLLHFAHFEKQAERIGEGRYLLRLRYSQSDETELVIRILSFGPRVRVLQPESMVALIRERLILQKSCEAD